jgi:hypothetical protein
MRHGRRAWLARVAVGVALLALSVPVAAQPRVELRAPTAALPMAVAARSVLSEKPFDELLRNGFPARVQFRAEVWTSGRWFDEIVDRVEWDVIVRYDQIDRVYEVVRRSREGLASLGSYSRFADARAASELPFLPTLNMPSGRQGYVSVQVDVQTLEISDLAEMQRWLQGEARPAVQGKRNPGTALTRGFRTLVTRLLGGEVRRLEARSGLIAFP